MYKSLVVLALVVVVLTEGCPTIKGRTSWGARNAKKVTRMARAAQYVVIHHTAGNQCANENACATRLKNIQSDHMSGNKNYDDIGYNFLIDHNGNIYEGRGWGVSGAHAPGYNSKSVGISIIGNYQTSQVSDKAAQAAKDVIACGVSNGKIISNYKILGHRQTKATACPGDNLYQLIKTWSHWSSSP
ncbi:Peptidoglycan recognition protein SB1 [Carabus blaptoides fortunei]